MKKIITIIPKFNQTPERLKQCYAISENYFVCDSIKEALWMIIMRKASICEIWYPHHFFLLVVCRIFFIKSIFSPVLCDIEWFEISKKNKINNYLYTLKRLKMTIYGFIAINFSNITFIQDQAFKPYWKKLCITNKKITAISNFFNTTHDIKNITKSKIGLIVSHSDLHKIFKLDEMIDSLPNEYELVWAGDVSDTVINKYKYQINFVGKVSRDSLNNLYKNSEILLIPSIYEGSPRVIYEAASWQVKVYTCELRGISNIRKKFPEIFEYQNSSNKNKKILDVTKLDLFNKRNVKKKRRALKLLETVT